MRGCTNIRAAGSRRHAFTFNSQRDGMTSRTIDAHAHILQDETIKLIQKETPAVGLKLTPIDDESAEIQVADKSFRPFPRGAWDLERRLKDMDAWGYDMQVVTVCPQTFLYNQEAALTLAVCQIQNDQIAALCAAMPERFMGLGTLPMQAPEKAAEELRRLMAKPGMHGVQIGSQVNGRQLDDPSLEPLWAAAAELKAFIMVHPMNAVGVPGVEKYYLKNLIGNPLDTTIAVASLVFGGVVERHPQIKFLMVHGGGFAPYQAGRFVHGWKVRSEPKVTLKGNPQESLDRLLYDTILHDPRPLEFLVGLVGASRVLLGTDYPFDMGQYDLGIIRGLDIPDADKATILGGAAVRLVGEPAAGRAAARRA